MAFTALKISAISLLSTSGGAQKLESWVSDV